MPRSDSSAAAPQPEVVLDTNAVLDWLVFDDPAMRGPGAAVDAGHWRWVTTQAMLDELFEVIARPALAALAGDGRALRDRVATLAQVVAMPALEAADILPCCDRDDQPFIDLAIARRARLLLTRDKALLSLARRARGFGVSVLRPAALDDKGAAEAAP
jgi:uncharacterized protein